MAFKTFAPGVLTSSDVNTFLMRQAVIVCTSSTRPASPSEGMVIYETDTDKLAAYNGAWIDLMDVSNWKDYSVTLDASATGWDLGSSTITARYIEVADTVFYRGNIEFSGATFGAGPFGLSVPVSLSAAGALGQNLGNGAAYDVSLSGAYALQVDQVSNYMEFRVLPASSTYLTMDSMISTRPFTWANGDRVTWTVTYESV